MTTRPVVVYTNGPTCVACNQTKRLMTQYGIEYTEVDLRENLDKLDEFREMGFSAAPIVTAGDQIWSGFHMERIKGLSHIRD